MPRALIDRRPPRRPSSWVDLGIALLVGSAVVWLARLQAGMLLTLAAGVLAFGFVARRKMTRHDKQTAILTAMVAATICDYLVWRAGVINWQAPWLSIPLYAAEVFAALQILGFHYTLWPREPVRLSDDEDPTTRPVFVLIPTVDEGADIVSQTVHAALVAREIYLAAHSDARVEIVVCNDGGVAGATCSADIEALCRRLAVRCITRAVGGGAKAGNLEHARRAVGATGDALIVIFDADQVAEPGFLLATIPNLRDSGVAWVQTGQYYRNLENPVARWANDQQAVFYRVLCQGKSATNAASICGTNVVMRAEALDEIGGFPQTSVTEDFAASIMLHQRWRSVFVPDVLAHGLGPLELGSYFGQQRRWARGSLGILRRHWRDIFMPRRHGGLRHEQRVQYALASTHYLCGLRDLVYVAVPIVFLTTGIAAVRGANLEQFLAHFVAYALLTQLAFWHATKDKAGWRGIVIGFGAFPVLTVAALRGLIRGGGTFVVTPKRRVGGSMLRTIAFQIACLAACVGAIVAAIVRGGGGAVLISALWAAYTGLLLAAFVGLAAADRMFARGRSFLWRRTLSVPRITWQSAAAFGVVVIALVVAVAPLASNNHQARAAAAGTANPRVGLDITTGVLAAALPTIDTRLGYHVGVVGRTQEISDHFDRTWAQTVVADGARPWVTLLFSAPRRPAFEASLLSVANGVHDGELQRWAREIREWGKPVDLTVLPQVDRDWAVTSAVANGGIPQDSARAWTHVRSVFRSEGVHNLTWIWAPADPSADGPYAPPAGTYDAVLLSLIEFPGTTWPDPQHVIASTRAEHPRDPLFIETSVAGPEEQRIAWLQHLGSAIRARSDIAALIYHEGSPTSDGTAAERAAWSLSADPRLIAAFSRAADQLSGFRTIAPGAGADRVAPDVEKGQAR